MANTMNETEWRRFLDYNKNAHIVTYLKANGLENAETARTYFNRRAADKSFISSLSKQNTESFSFSLLIGTGFSAQMGYNFTISPSFFYAAATVFFATLSCIVVNHSLLSAKKNALQQEVIKNAKHYHKTKELIPF